MQADCSVAVDGNSYRVPWRLIGESARVAVADGRVRIHHADAEMAVHPETTGRRQRIADRANFDDVGGLVRPTGIPEPPRSRIRRGSDEGWAAKSKP